MSFIAGRYTATLASNSLGQTAEGYRVSHQHFARLITGDAFAKMTQDTILQGVDMFIDYTLIEYNAAGALSAFWPFKNTIYDVGVIGRLGSAVGGTLILTAVANTPAAATPASLTLSTCILAEGFPVSILYGPDLREVPIKQRVLPNSSGVFGTTT